MFTLKRSYGNALRRLKGSGRSKAISEITIPVTKNKLGMEAAEVEKNSKKMFAPRMRAKVRYIIVVVKFFVELFWLVNAAISREKLDSKARGLLSD